MGRATFKGNEAKVKDATSLRDAHTEIRYQLDHRDTISDG